MWQKTLTALQFFVKAEEKGGLATKWTRQQGRGHQ